MAECAHPAHATADSVLEELAKTALSDIVRAFNPNGTLKPLDEMSPDARAVIVLPDVADVRDRDGNVLDVSAKRSSQTRWRCSRV